MAANPDSIRERCRQAGIERYAIYNRMRQGMTVDEAFESATSATHDSTLPYMIERRELAALMRRWRRGGIAR